MHMSFDPTAVNDVSPLVATGVEQDTKSEGATERPTGDDQQEILASYKKELNEIHHRYKDHASRMAEDAIKAGNILIEVKRIVGHGKFGLWISDNCVFKERMAQYYMLIAESGLKSATVAVLGIRGAAKEVQNEIARRSAATGKEDKPAPKLPGHRARDLHHRPAAKATAAPIPRQKVQKDLQAVITDLTAELAKRVREIEEKDCEIAEKDREIAKLRKLLREATGTSDGAAAAAGWNEVNHSRTSRSSRERVRI
jgi:hypothetical protein